MQVKQSTTEPHPTLGPFAAKSGSAQSIFEHTLQPERPCNPPASASQTVETLDLCLEAGFKTLRQVSCGGARGHKFKPCLGQISETSDMRSPRGRMLAQLARTRLWV